MNRRSFLSLSLVSPIVAFLGFKAKPVGFGYLDVDIALANGFLPAQVFLDGVPLPQCHTLNDVEGWADCWVTDGPGQVVIDPETLDRPLSRRRYGRVTYIPNPNGKPGIWGHA